MSKVRLVGWLAACLQKDDFKRVSVSSVLCASLSLESWKRDKQSECVMCDCSMTLTCSTPLTPTPSATSTTQLATRGPSLWWMRRMPCFLMKPSPGMLTWKVLLQIMPMLCCIFWFQGIFCPAPSPHASHTYVMRCCIYYPRMSSWDRLLRMLYFAVCTLSSTRSWYQLPPHHPPQNPLCGKHRGRVAVLWLLQQC